MRVHWYMRCFNKERSPEKAFARRNEQIDGRGRRLLVGGGSYPLPKWTSALYLAPTASELLIHR
jgi:hypothetical protein